MISSKAYSYAALGFSVVALVVFVYGGYIFLGIPTIDLFFALVALSYVFAFTGMMKSTKSLLSWAVLIIISVLVLCVVYFISNFI